MISMSQVAAAAKFLFPAKADIIDKALGMAQQFQPSKDGVAQLMQQYGKSREDLRNAAGMLNSPMAQKVLSRIPGLGDALREAASEINNGAQGAPAPREAPSAPAAPAGRSIAERLAALR